MRYTTHSNRTPSRYESLASLQHDQFDSVVGLTDLNSTSEPCLSDHSASTIVREDPGQLSTPELPSGISLEEPFRNQNVSNTSVLNAEVNKPDSDVESIDIHSEPEHTEDLTVYEVVTEYQGVPSTSNADYPRIFLQLREGQIINVETGEIMINLSQFVAVDEPTEPCEGDIISTVSSQTSPRPLFIDSEFTSTQEPHEISVNEETKQLSILSQSLLGHEETVIAESTMEDVEGEVMREVRSLIAYPPPEGWVDDERRMTYHTNKSEWGSEGVTIEEMDMIKQCHTSKVPTNADCIKALYNHDEVDDPRVPDHIHYRRCNTELILPDRLCV